jgi:hypothetical protein
MVGSVTGGDTLCGMPPRAMSPWNIKGLLRVNNEGSGQSHVKMSAKCNGLQTRSLGLANNVDFELILAANMRGREPTLAANELRCITTSLQTVARTHIECI